jgi:hypothetical protein
MHLESEKRVFASLQTGIMIAQTVGNTTQFLCGIRIMLFPQERFDHGSVGITYVECGLLGIDFVTLVDEHIETKRDALKVEQACQYVIDDLQLGTQRSTLGCCDVDP